MTKAKLQKISVTLVLVFVALISLRWTFSFYTDQPWTRDAKIRSDVIALAPDVSGRVVEVLVHDNDEVKKGQVLFRVDKDRLALALQRSEAALINARALRNQTKKDADRYLTLHGAISDEIITLKQTQAQQAEATFRLVQSDRDLAALNLERADVKAPEDGYLTNFNVRPGTFVALGVPVCAFVSKNSFYVAAYFEENKLRHIKTGDVAKIQVMGEDEAMEGKVESVSAGIEDRDRTTSAGTFLPNVNPTFNWIRLPQRVPVRIAFTNVSKGILLVSGRTTTVTIYPRE